MSKFIDDIKTQMTGRQLEVNTPLKVDVMKQASPMVGDYPMSTLSEYLIGVKWQYRAFCTKETLPKMQENVVRELREDIYGDLRRRIIRLERAIYEHDFDTASMEVRDMGKEIFG